MGTRRCDSPLQGGWGDLERTELDRLNQFEPIYIFKNQRVFSVVIRVKKNIRAAGAQCQLKN